MKFQSAFTPLRITLMIFIVIVNIAAAVAFGFPEAPWSRYLGIFATVFILMMVFLLILEFVWLISFKKQDERNFSFNQKKKTKFRIISRVIITT